MSSYKAYLKNKYLIYCPNYVKLDQIIACLELKYLLKKTGFEASKIKTLLKFLTINEM